MFTETTGNKLITRIMNVFSTEDRGAYGEESDNLNPSIVTTSSEKIMVEQSRKEVSNSGLGQLERMPEKERAVRTVQVSAPQVSLPEEKDLDIRFATKFIQVGGKFIFCENIKQAIEGIKMLKEEQEWSHVFCWENEIRDSFSNYNFQKGVIGFTIENSDAAISLCETLIADEGTIVLNPKQASRRRLPCFPKTHVILTDIAHLAGSESEGLEKFYQRHKGELPSIIKIGTCNNGHFYDKQRLILNAEGPENIYVFLVDELIPTSLRP